MAKIVNTRNNGNPSIRYGEVVVNSKNLSPVALTATASGYTLTQANIDSYDMFNVAQTSASTDKIVLPSTFPVGTVLEFFFVSAASIGVATGASQTINNGADTTKVACAASTSAEVRKVSSTRWIVTAYAAAGTVSAPTPS